MKKLIDLDDKTIEGLGFGAYKKQWSLKKYMESVLTAKAIVLQSEANRIASGKGNDKLNNNKKNKK